LKIKVISSFAGPRVEFRYGQIIECPGKVGARLIATGVGEEAEDSLKSEGTFDDETPEEEREPPTLHKKSPEKATLATGEKATTGSGPTGEHCEGETRQGNRCLRTPLPNSKFCAAHQPEKA